MNRLVHNGVLVPEYEWKGFRIFIKGADVELTPEQEEMAIAWVRKLGTDYVKDNVFARNFFKDFRKALSVDENLSPEDFDFSIIEDHLEKEKAAKLSLSKEEKKRLREERKTLREARKQKYGYALIDGVKTEISNYTAEPSCIFMGRGKHPLRGRWKQGPSQEDIELNLSPDAPRPSGDWKAFVWQPDVMWIARWRDKLSGKTRYVWLAENSALKQKKDIEKFDKAKELRQNLALVKRYIRRNLDADDLKRRKTATVCYLIDKLKIRVGDEKDPEEADTVGASTLRPEHIRFKEDGNMVLSFLGKDSVPHVFDVKLPEKVVRNLREFSATAESTLFDGVDSQRVSEFLDEVMAGLSAKLFRTCYASEAVENKLETTSVRIEEPDHVKKYVATMANLKAAKICNHRRTPPKNWENSLQKKKTSLKDRIRRAREAQQKIKSKITEKRARYTRQMERWDEKLKAMMEKLEGYEEELAERSREGKPVTALQRRVSAKRRAVRRQKERIRKLKTRYREQRRKLKERLEKRKRRDAMLIEKTRLQIETKKETRDYNLGTSLKSYIDPRIYYRWGKKVDYDWKLYYSKALRKKFSWVDTDIGEEAERQISG